MFRQFVPAPALSDASPAEPKAAGGRVFLDIASIVSLNQSSSRRLCLTRASRDGLAPRRRRSCCDCLAAMAS
jgi:hypothetical protein